MIEGVDVHHLKIVHDWAQVRAAGVRFAMLKVSQGLWPDPAFEKYATDSLAAGVLPGGYHFGDANHSGDVQAAFFLQRSNLKVIALDWEWHPNGQAQTMTAVQARAFVQAVKARRALSKVMLYTSAAFLDSQHFKPINEDPLLECDLWVAGITKTVRLPKWWKAYRLWQYSIRPCPGIGGPAEMVDRDRWNDNEDALLTYFTDAIQPSESVHST